MAFLRVQVSTVEELFQELCLRPTHRINGLHPSLPAYLFRGHASATWHVTSTLHRLFSAIPPTDPRGYSSSDDIWCEHNWHQTLARQATEFNSNADCLSPDTWTDTSRVTYVTGHYRRLVVMLRTLADLAADAGLLSGAAATDASWLLAQTRRTLQTTDSGGSLATLRGLVATVPNLVALAQHHGIATPLIDWTSNPLVALHFAVEAKPTDVSEEASVWMFPTDLLDRTPNVEVFRPVDETYARMQCGFFLMDKLAEDEFVQNGEIHCLANRFPDVSKDITSMPRDHASFVQGHMRQVVFPKRLSLEITRVLSRLQITRVRLMPSLANVVSEAHRRHLLW